MLETHPFDTFSPPGARYLILGSFAGRQAVKGSPVYDPSYDWYYGTSRNQFWPILEQVYGLELQSKSSKQALFTHLGIAIADIILSCERIDGNNSDSNLKKITYNIAAIELIVDKSSIDKIFFTSRFVENCTRREFKALLTRHPEIELIALPSPSPRYRLMNLEQKIARYTELLPKL